MSKFAVEVKNLNLKSSSGKSLISQVSASFEPGRLHMILGPNGAGKTLMLKCISGLLDGYEGEVSYFGESTRLLSVEKRAKLLSWLPSETHQSFDFKAIDIVIMGRFPHHRGQIGMQDKKKALEYMKLLEIEDLKQRYYPSLSHGEKIKVQLARVLSCEAPIVILDEICANLDIKSKIQNLKLLRELSQQGLTVILSHHDLHTVAAYSDTMLLMKDAKVLRQGSVPECFTEDQLEECFGIRPKLWCQHGALLLSF